MRPRARAKSGRSGSCYHRGLLEAKSSFLCRSQALDLNRILRRSRLYADGHRPGVREFMGKIWAEN